MNNMLHPYLDKFVVVFVDNILVYSKTKEENEEHLYAILQLLREHKIYTKLRKYDLFQPQIHYLGHTISKEGVEVDPEKVNAIIEWTTPKNVVEVMLFMGQHKNILY